MDKHSGATVVKNWKYILRRKYPEIKEHLDNVAIGELTDRLFANNIISSEHKEKISANATRNDKAGTLLDIVIDQGENGCEMMVRQMGMLEPQIMKDLHRQLQTMYSQEINPASEENNLTAKDVLMVWQSAQNDDYVSLFSSRTCGMIDSLTQMRLGPITHWIEEARDQLLEDCQPKDRVIVRRIHNQIRYQLLGLTDDKSLSNVSIKVTESPDKFRLILSEFYRRILCLAIAFLKRSTTDDAKQVAHRVIEYLRSAIIKEFQYLSIPFDDYKANNDMKIELIDDEAFIVYERTVYVFLNNLIPHNGHPSIIPVDHSDVCYVNYDKTKQANFEAHGDAFKCFRPVEVRTPIVVGPMTRSPEHNKYQLVEDHPELCYLAKHPTFEFVKAKLVEQFPDIGIKEGIDAGKPYLYFERTIGLRATEVHRYIPTISYSALYETIRSDVCFSKEETDIRSMLKDNPIQFVFEVSAFESGSQPRMKKDIACLQTILMTDRNVDSKMALQFIESYLKEKEIYDLGTHLIANAIIWELYETNAKNDKPIDQYELYFAAVKRLIQQAKNNAFVDFLFKNLEHSTSKRNREKLCKLEIVRARQMLETAIVTERTSLLQTRGQAQADTQLSSTSINSQNDMKLDIIDDLLLNPCKTSNSVNLFKTCLVVFCSIMNTIYTMIYDC